MKRLVWLDVAKGIGILWIVYFHFFTTWRSAPSPLSDQFLAEVAAGVPGGWGTFPSALETLAKTLWYGVTGLGFHAVGLFIIVSGWSLAATTARKAEKGPIAWGEWYWSRFIRLYPMYWVAHLVYLVSPMVARLEPVDGRFLWSLAGLRMVNIEMTFMYVNAAWWYFAMLIQLYLLFPLFFLALRKLGPWTFLALAFAVGFGTRWIQLDVLQSVGSWILGGFALSRLPEFALGMVLGWWHLRAPEGVERGLRNGGWLGVGLALYAVWFVFRGIPYIFTDFLTGTACFFAVCGVSGMIERWAGVAKWLATVGAFSYGLYLLHQPYVIWLGLRIHDEPWWRFLLCVAIVWVVIGAWGMFLEKQTNRLVDWLAGTKKPTAKPAVAAG